MRLTEEPTLEGRVSELLSVIHFRQHFSGGKNGLKVFILFMSLLSSSLSSTTTDPGHERHQLLEY